MRTYTTRLFSGDSSSGSEPTSPELSPSLMSTSSSSLSSMCNAATSSYQRRRSASLSGLPAPSFSKKRTLRDVLLERTAHIVPSMIILFVGMLLVLHLIIGIKPGSSLNIDVSPIAFSQDSQKQRMLNAEVVSELERWKHADYAKQHLKVYYYDLPTEFNSDLVEDSHRNPPKIRDPFCDENFYSAENTIANFFKNGPVRTYNASEADFFYVPIYTTCYLITNLPNDVNKTGKFFEKAMDIVVNDYPYWNSSDGRDHVMMFAQGFGSRLSGNWTRYRHATFLVHNGDYDEEHFNTHKDIVVPPDLSHYFTPVGITSPNKLVAKTSFVMFGGQVLNTSISDHRGANYSGGVRQFIQSELSAVDGYKVTGVRSETYVEDIKQSVFCLAPHGWHKWSPRPAYAILLGCIPVLISEKQELFLENLIDYSKISYWVHPEEIHGLDNKLRRIKADELMGKEQSMREVWRMLWYGNDGLAEEAIMYSLFRKLATSRTVRSYI